MLRSAQSPLVVIGKGAAFAQGSERSLAEYIHLARLPFLPTPMGKGVVSDLDEHCVGPARSLALKQADVVFLIGTLAVVTRYRWSMFRSSTQLDPSFW